MTLHEQLARLRDQWREEADGIEAVGYSQQADRVRHCADDLDTLLAQATPTPETVTDAAHQTELEQAKAIIRET